jgi:hypothetical protein
MHSHRREDITSYRKNYFKCLREFGFTLVYYYYYYYNYYYYYRCRHCCCCCYYYYRCRYYCFCCYYLVIIIIILTNSLELCTIREATSGAATR